MVSTRRHQPVNQKRGICADKSDAASRRAYSCLPQMGKQCTGSPRAYCQLECGLTDRISLKFRI